MFFFCVAHVVKGKNLSEKGMDIFGKGLFGNDVQSSLGGGFKYFLFSSLLGEMIQFHKYFSNGLVQPPTRSSRLLFFSEFASLAPLNRP